MINLRNIGLFFCFSLLVYTQKAVPSNKNEKKLYKPKLTVMIIIDQLGDIYVQKVYKYLNYGLKKLLDQGTYYVNAYHPHGMPATGTGHAGLSTGSFARYHGIIGNKWIDPVSLEKIECDADTVEKGAVINPVDGSRYDYGSSSRNCMVDNLSDQFMLASSPELPHKVFSISSKSRAANMTSGMTGKPIWFDSMKGLFTSSIAHFEELPWWLMTFNKNNNINNKKFVFWPLIYPKNSFAYHRSTQITYEFTHQKSPRVNTHVPVKKESAELYKKGDLYSSYQTTPQANEQLLELGKACLSAELDPHDNSHMLLWLCLSPLDKLGHDYGPDSVETLDLLYHIDRQIEDFMEWTEKKYGKNNILWCLTGDHGIGPIVEVAHQKGLKLARRFYVPDVLDKINNYIKTKYGIDNIIGGFKCPQIYLNQEVLAPFNTKTRWQIEHDIIEFVKKMPGVKDAWSFQELKKGYFATNTPEYYLQQQLFEGRSGDITLLTYPQSMITKWKQGADHRSPYQFNLHVPISIYWPGTLKQKRVQERVLTLQLPRTIAELLDVESPSACEHPTLPQLMN